MPLYTACHYIHYNNVKKGITSMRHYVLIEISFVSISHPDKCADVKELLFFRRPYSKNQVTGSSCCFIVRSVVNIYCERVCDNS